MKYRYFVSFVTAPDRVDTKCLGEMFQHAVVELPSKVDSSVSLEFLDEAILEILMKKYAGTRHFFGSKPTILSFQLLKTYNPNDDPPLVD